MIAFVHIERTGGSKINNALMSRFEDRRLIVTGSGETQAQLRTLLSKTVQPRDFYLGGHVRFDLIAGFIGTPGPDRLLFSTTRHPVERAVSAYFLALRSPEWLPELSPVAQREGFPAFYAAGQEHGLLRGDRQCFALSGTRDFRRTLDVIREQFDLVGTHRHYPALLRRLEQRIGEYGLPGFAFDAARVNAAYHYECQAQWVENMPLDQVVDPETRRRIEADNAHDLSLVAYLESLPDGLWDRRNA